MIVLSSLVKVRAYVICYVIIGHLKSCKFLLLVLILSRSYSDSSAVVLGH